MIWCYFSIGDYVGKLSGAQRCFVHETAQIKSQKINHPRAANVIKKKVMEHIVYKHFVATKSQLKM